MPVTGGATVASQAQAQSKAFADSLFAFAQELLEAYKVEQSGTLVNYDRLGEQIAKHAAELLRLTGALATLDAVRDGGPRRESGSAESEAKR